MSDVETGQRLVKALTMAEVRAGSALADDVRQTAGAGFTPRQRLAIAMVLADLRAELLGKQALDVASKGRAADKVSMLEAARDKPKPPDGAA